MRLVAPSLKLAVANNMGWAMALRRDVQAFGDALRSTRRSYSEHQEDAWVLEELRKLDLRGGVYVEVGANHPTRISNTYLLYRHGLRGVVIEPDAALLRLHRRVRPGDIAVGVGCGRAASLGRFHVLSRHVLSSFSEEHLAAYAGTRLRRVDYVPILPLDTVMAAIAHEWIYFLSIDTEGFDDEVLAGAPQTLERTLFLCVEAYNEEMEGKVRAQLPQHFTLIRRVGINLLLRNATFWRTGSGSVDPPDPG
jgi:FkbM family methyltransferase